MQDFCTSSCHDELAAFWTTCENDMTTDTHDAFSALAVQIESCGAASENAICNIQHVSLACGGDLTAAVVACDAICMGAVDSMNVACAANIQWPRTWGQISEACAGAQEAQVSLLRRNKLPYLLRQFVLPRCRLPTHAGYLPTRVRRLFHVLLLTLRRDNLLGRCQHNGQDRTLQPPVRR